MAIKTYHVYFEQVNQQHYEVRAKHPKNAVKTAKKLWNSENTQPRMWMADENNDELIYCD